MGIIEREMGVALRVLVLLGLCVGALSATAVQEVTDLTDLTQEYHQLGEGVKSVSALHQEPDEEVDAEEAELESESNSLDAAVDDTAQAVTDADGNGEPPAIDTGAVLAECQAKAGAQEQDVLKYQAAHEKCNVDLGEVTLQITHAEKKAAEEAGLREKAELQTKTAMDEKEKAETQTEDEKVKLAEAAAKCNTTTAAQMQANLIAVAATVTKSTEHENELKEQSAVMQVEAAKQKT